MVNFTFLLAKPATRLLRSKFSSDLTDWVNFDSGLHAGEKYFCTRLRPIPSLRLEAADAAGPEQNLQRI